MQDRSDQEGNVHFSVTMPFAVVAKLDAMAASEGSSRSSVVRALVIKGIERDALIQKIAQAVA